MHAFDRVVTNMMNRYGSFSTLIVPSDSEGVYDAATSEFVVPAPEEYVVKTLVFDYTLQSNGTQAMPHTLIQAGDKQVFIQPLDKSDPALTMPRIRPEKDFIEIGGVRYKIVTCKELNPSMANNSLYELLVRK